MSRIGKKPITIPQDVKVEIAPAGAGRGQEVKVSGPKGELKQTLLRQIKAEVKDGKIFVAPQEQLTKKSRELWGLYRALISNMVEGASKGFEKKLEIEGVGYKAAVEGDGLTLNLGFTNPIKIKNPGKIKFFVEKNVITVSGPSKEVVGHISALIRKCRKAEPYKGKGIKYQGERIRRKEGKKVVAAKK